MRRFVAGVISRERIPTFERMLWRVCRGNVFLRKAEIEDPLEDPATVRDACEKLQQCRCWFLIRNSFLFHQGDQVHKSVFIIFFQGDQLKNRVKKICEGSVLSVMKYVLFKRKLCVGFTLSNSGQQKKGIGTQCNRYKIKVDPNIWLFLENNYYYPSSMPYCSTES